MPVSLVTPSTSVATSSPKRSRTSSSDALVSSTVSCSSAAHSVSVSRRMPAQIFATPTGWTMKSSPDLRRWSAWCSQAKRKASSTRSRSISTAASSACSSTIANRSPSRRRSVSVSSARRTGACASGCATRSTGTRSAGAGPPLRGAAGAAAGGGSVRGSGAMSSGYPLRQRVLRPFGGVRAALSAASGASRRNSLIERSQRCSERERSAAGSGRVPNCPRIATGKRE